MDEDAGAAGALAVFDAEDDDDGALLAEDEVGAGALLADDEDVLKIFALAVSICF